MLCSYIAVRDIVSRSTWFTKDRLRDAGILHTVRIPVSMVSDIILGPGLLHRQLLVLDRRGPGQLNHRALLPRGHRVSGLLCTSCQVQHLTLDCQVDGLDMLWKVGMQVILDHHMLPDAQAVIRKYVSQALSGSNDH